MKLNPPTKRFIHNIRNSPKKKKQKGITHSPQNKIHLFISFRKSCHFLYFYVVPIFYQSVGLFYIFFFGILYIIHFCIYTDIPNKP